MKCAFHPLKKGFSLLENILSLGIVSVIVPTALGALSLSLDHELRTRQETTSMRIADYFFTELPCLWSDTASSLLFTHLPPQSYPTLPATTYSVLFTREGTPHAEQAGEAVTLISHPDLPHLSSHTVSSGFIATLTLGEAPPLSTSDTTTAAIGWDTERISKFTLQVSSPAGSPAHQRKTYTYSRLIRQP